MLRPTSTLTCTLLTSGSNPADTNRGQPCRLVDSLRGASDPGGNVGLGSTDPSLVLVRYPAVEREDAISWRHGPGT